MRTLGRMKRLMLGTTLALCACGEVEKAMDKIEAMDKEMAGETQTEPTAPTAPAAPAAPMPEPEPTAEPTPVPAAPEPVVEPEAVPKPSTSTSTPTKPSASTTTTTKTTTTTTTTKPPTVKPEPAKPEPVKPEPVAVKPEPAKPEPVQPEPVAVKPEPAPSKVSIPQSKHVQVSAPKRVQELLDADPRMQPWLNNTMKVIEQCYADLRKENANSEGTIVFQLEMHKNARPDADITSLPASLSGVVACATGKLMRAARMPLFTGNEGEKHTVRVKFTP